MTNKFYVYDMILKVAYPIFSIVCLRRIYKMNLACKCYSNNCALLLNMSKNAKVID